MTEKNTTRKPRAEEEVAQEVAQEEQAPVQLSLQDLETFAQIIDVATSRGAFKAAELSQVGAAFDRLSAFLKQVAATQAANAEATQADDAEVEAPVAPEAE